MTYGRGYIPTLAPFAQESWAGQGADTSIEVISVLGPGGSMGYVRQGQIREFHPDGTANVGSEGFGKGSGLAIRDRGTGMDIVSHLEPFADAWHDSMQSGQRDPVRWDSRREAVLVYGSVSSRQYELEGLMAAGFWGPVTLSIIEAETGDAHWGMVLYRSLGQLAVVRKTPDQSIFRYRLFEPAAG